VDGVSLATWVLLVLLAFFWIVHGITTVGSWEIVAGSLFALPLQLLILYRLRPRDRCHVGARSLVLVSVCCAGPALWWGGSGAVIGVGSASSFTRLPQLIRLVREREAAGVSVGSWSMAVLVSALWVVYYAGAPLGGPHRHGARRYSEPGGGGFVVVATRAVLVCVMWRTRGYSREDIRFHNI